MSFAITAFVGLSTGSAYLSAEATNDQIEQSIDSAERRYQLKKSVAEGQMTEQQQLATEKMTDISRAFLQAKGTAKAVQAESMVGGNVQKIKEFQLDSKETEAKGKVAREIDTNVINIAQGMLASKIDTEAIIDEAISKGSYGASYLLDIVGAGIGGAVSGVTLKNASEG